MTHAFKVVVFPNAKINLGLGIISKREDGYHNISSCFYPIPLSDILEVFPSNSFRFNSSGIDIPDDTNGNLCIKAYELLKADFDLKPVNIHLHKIIPIGAGLGGGSADASFTLKCLNEIFSLKLSTQQLESYASKLGSDCPFFIESKPVLAEGTGNIFSKIDVDLSGLYLVLINPGIHVSTAQAYSKVTPASPVKSINDILSEPIDNWQSGLKNDFEPSVFSQFPEIEEIKTALIKAGALYASMSGSGSSVYGLFEKPVKLSSHLEKHLIWQGML